ncbi:MAG: cell division ATPase MinD [Nanoarchaeota archaeon]|nr:cell division ATPase MinD [Nanoarchaeota archaeon]
MTRIIGIVSAKGGVGKTTVTANLGAALTSFGKRTAVVDCNLTNPHLGLILGLLPNWKVTLNDVIKGRSKLSAAVHNHPSGLQVIPAAFEVRDIRSLNLHQLRNRIRDTFSRQRVDFVILDSSPGLFNEGLLTLRACQEIYFVATPHMPAIIDITKTIALLKKRDAKPSGIILNRVRNKPYELRDDEIEHFTHLPVLARIPEDENVLKATNFKVPVVTQHPGSKASVALSNFAADLAGIQKPTRFSFFGNLFRRGN